MLDLALDKEHLTLVAFVVELELATLASHFKRLHQVDDVHLREVAANHAVRGRGLRHLLERDAVDRALDAARGFFQEERLGQVVVGGILRRKPFINVDPARHQDGGKICRSRPALQPLDQLAAIHAGHAVIADHQIRRIIDRLEQGISRVASSHHACERSERLLQHSQNHGIIVD